jgi:fibronectin type 3 domain-containing protein
MIQNPKQNDTVKDLAITVEGKGIPYTNIEIDGGTQKATGDTDSQGLFAVPIQLDPNFNEYTLHISDNLGNEASLHLVRDTAPPIVGSAIFSPEKPEEGTNTLLVVQSEPGLPFMALKMGEEEFQLKEDLTKPGIYQLLFTAPKAGDFQPIIRTTDQAGNALEMMVSFSVLSKMLPTVQNVKAEAHAGSVDLTWDAVKSEPVDKYRIYIAENGGEFSSNLDADAKTTKATVTGLNAGVPYTFAVTALKDTRESTKSEPVTATPLGLTMTVTPQKEALSIEWSAQAALPIATFQIEYGADAEHLDEKRAVAGGDIAAGEKRAIVLHDLLPGVQYFVRMTPIATTGEPIQDLIANGNGTPLAVDGFHPSAGDPLPFSASTQFPQIQQHTTENPQTGLPTFAWSLAGGTAVLLALLQWHRHRSKRYTTEFMRMMEAQYRRI